MGNHLMAHSDEPEQTERILRLRVKPLTSPPDPENAGAMDIDVETRETSVTAAATTVAAGAMETEDALQETPALAPSTSPTAEQTGSLPLSPSTIDLSGEASTVQDTAASTSALAATDPVVSPQPTEEAEVGEHISSPSPDSSLLSSGLLSDGWRGVAESVRGTSHEKTGANCQDAHQLALLENHTLIAAISDGAGSAAQAELGSSTAVRSVLEDLRSFSSRVGWPEEDGDWQKLLHVVLGRARKAVEHTAADCGAKPRDLASTLLVLIAMPHLVVAAQIGDGAIVVEDSEGALTALTKPQSGEYLNETIFLISPDALEQAQICIWRGQVTHLAAFSDGLQMLALKMNEGAPHPPFFAPLFRFVREMTDLQEAKTQMNAFLRSPRITQRADDDLTLLLAHWPHGPS
jgi:hypothetical protein